MPNDNVQAELIHPDPIDQTVTSNASTMDLPQPNDGPDPHTTDAPLDSESSDLPVNENNVQSLDTLDNNNDPASTSNDQADVIY